VAEDAGEDLEVWLDAGLQCEQKGAYHNHRDGEQYPPTVVMLAMPAALDRDHVQQGGIPMDRLHNGL
jgi:hypothetical protein